MNRFILLLALLPFSHPLAAQPSPVVVGSVESNLSQAQQKKVVEQLSDSIRTGILRALGRQVYGSGDEYAAELPESALAVFVASVKTIEDQIEEDYELVRRELGPDDRLELQFEIGWTPSSVAASSSGFAAIGMLWNMVKAPVRTLVADRPHLFSVIDASARMSFIPRSQMDMTAFYGHGQSNAQYFIENFRDQMIPLYMRVSYDVSDSGIDTSYYVVMKPTEIVKRDFEQDGDVKIHALAWRPQRARDIQVFGINLDKTIASATRRKPRFSVRFGRLGSSDVRVIRYCQTREVGRYSCDKYTDLIPTIHTSYTRSGIGGGVAWVAGLSNPKIMISTLAIDVDTLEVIPQQSTLPVLAEDIRGNVRIIDKNMEAHPFNYLEQGRRAGLGNQVEEGFTARLQDIERGPLAPIIQLLR